MSGYKFIDDRGSFEMKDMTLEELHERLEMVVVR